MFLTLCSHYTVPPWWKQSFHPCFECALHSKTDRFNCTHSYSARQCSDTCISEQSSTLMNEASYCMYNIQHFFSLRSSIATSKSLLFPPPRRFDRGSATQIQSVVEYRSRRLRRLRHPAADPLNRFKFHPPQKFEKIIITMNRIHFYKKQ